MHTTLFLSVSLDGFIADQNGIPRFPEGAWDDWCALVNATDNVIAGRSSFEQLQEDPMGSILHPKHRVVLSTQDIDVADSGWTHARSPAEALKLLEDAGVEEAIIGGGRAVASAFMREGLVDQIVFDLQPVAFGTGVPIFGDALEGASLRLLESQSLNENAVRLRYQVLRDGN
ncbi:MAG: dihydrofolate reductase family protein [Wenzhouxiangella sp.]|jgi:dihydrofolate reductase|nr:dihydrofolate reductase family protein [Wenzhouxiangella sp.]